MMYLKNMVLEKVNSSVAADYALKNGKVKLNGTVATDGRLPADSRDRIEIDIEDINEDNDFWMMKIADEEHSIFDKGDIVLFLGCLSESIPNYISQKTSDISIVGGEVNGFKTIDENPIRSTYDTIFEKTRSKCDVLVADLGVDVIRVMEAVQGKISLLKERGYLILRLTNKERDNDDLETFTRNFLDAMNIETIKIIKNSDGITVLARRSDGGPARI